METSETATQWIPVPTGHSKTSYGESTDQYPSAFLLIQNVGSPHFDSPVTCSVKANWAPGYHVTTDICYPYVQTQRQGPVVDYDVPLFWWSSDDAYTPKKPIFKELPKWQPVELGIVSKVMD